MAEIIGYIAAGIVGIVIGAAFFWGRNKELERRNAKLEDLDNRFSEISQNALRQSNEQFLQLAQEKLKQAQGEGAHELSKRQEAIKNLVEPMNKALSELDQKIQSLEKSRVSAYSELRQQLAHMTNDQDKLRKETASLVQALRTPSTRGQWGEMQLKRCLEMAGMQEGVHYDTQVSSTSEEHGNQRPDILVKLSGGQSIIIDAKAPIESYLNAFQDDISDSERDEYLTKHARLVREHLKHLGSKSYWKQFDTPEFVVMFLPGESYFSAALEKDPSLIEFGVDQKVIPATPTTLISMLKAVMYGWRQEQLAQNARDISEQGAELYKRITTFANHMDGVGRGLNTALNKYNEAVGSLEKSVLPGARKLKEMHVQVDSKEIPDLSQIETIPRALTSDEFERNEKNHSSYQQSS